MFRRILPITVITVFVSFGFAQRSDLERDTAWEVMLSQNPELVDDPSIGWRDRLVMHVLTPAQAKDYYQGADAESLTLADGTTLADYLAARLSPPGNVYVPLPTPCQLFEGRVSESKESLVLMVRGDDLSAQGGSVTGCGISKEAVAVVLQIQSQSRSGMTPRLKLWATDAPEPAETILDEEMGVSEGYETIAMVPLCVTKVCEGDLQLRGAEASEISAEAVGYFRPLVATDHPGGIGGIDFYTEGLSNNYFGNYAGQNAIGIGNSFFGGSADRTLFLQSQAGGSRRRLDFLTLRSCTGNLYPQLSQSSVGQVLLGKSLGAYGEVPTLQ